MEFFDFVTSYCDTSAESDGASSFYGALYALWGLNKEDDIYLIRKLIFERSARMVIEYGSGFGRIPFRLRMGGLKYLGVDRVQYYIDMANLYLSEHYSDGDKINFCCEDVCRDVYYGNADVAICAHNFINEIMPNRIQDFFLNVKNNLTDEGIVYVKSITFPIARSHGIAEVVGKFVDRDGVLWLVSVLRDPEVYRSGVNMFVFFDSYKEGVHHRRILKELRRFIYSYEDLDGHARNNDFRLNFRDYGAGISIYERK